MSGINKKDLKTIKFLLSLHNPDKSYIDNWLNTPHPFIDVNSTCGNHKTPLQLVETGKADLVLKFLDTFRKYN